MKISAKTFLATLVIAAPLVLGCGSKAKPAETTTASTSTGDEGATSETKAPETASTEAPAAAPASLGDVVYFEFDSSELSAEARAQLEENARWLEEEPSRTLTVEGHTDEVGTAEYNLALGDRRARAAVDYLVKLGVAPERVKIITFGEERPAGGDAAKNRRSMFIATRK